MLRKEAIAKLIPVFRKYGYEGTTLSLLSKASGLGKASLYHHFPGGKEEIATAVFEYVGIWFSKTVLNSLQSDREPKLKIKAMSEKLREFYDNGKESCFSAIMSFGEANNLFHDRVKQRTQVLIDTLAQVLIEGGIKPELAQMRSQNAIIQIQGALILVRILDDTAPFERVITSLPEQLLKTEKNFS
jgi:TetR/AcrR family transcriptional regulator, lmrAB and yxaGH operons repressor